jgi:hypothetical protein
VDRTSSTALTVVFLATVRGIRIRLIFLAVHFVQTGQNMWRASRLS